MKTFLLKSIIFFLIAISLVSIILIQFGGYVDYFYEKFTTPKATSMIIGDSRAMQGIQPKIVDSILSKSKFDLPILNYSFTIAQSHIGPLYTKSILKKLNKKTTNGLFIISINPWMLASRKENNNYKGEFKEDNTPPHNMTTVNSNPNFEYLIKNFKYFHFRSIFRRSSKLHKDGWLEENNLPNDSIIYNSWKEKQLSIFKGFTKDYKISEYRKKSLDTLINKLKPFGKVFLVRTPISREMLNLENSFYNGFDYFLDSLAQKNKITYFNYNKNQTDIYRTYDGHHLDKIGGAIFTRNLCNSILKNK